MLKRLFIFIITSQLFINGICATAHAAGEDHAPHYLSHLDNHHHADNQSVDDIKLTDFHWANVADVEALQKNLAEDHHAGEGHLHCFIYAYLLPNDICTFSQNNSERPISFLPAFSSLTYTPPVPPPTA